MRVEKLGTGEPEFTVIGSLHGDEPCGKKAIERFLSEDWDVRKPVQFVVANEKALEKNTRYIDSDLNRSFPGNPKSEKHEERLAARIMEVARDTFVLDLHSTHSSREPFAIFEEDPCESQIEAVERIGVKKAAIFPGGNGALCQHVKGLNIEAGFQGSQEATENAYRIILNFLGMKDVIERRPEREEVEFFRKYETVEGSGWEFVAENFKPVEKGEVFARKGEREITAEEKFYPVLMSTDGYEEIIGHKAEKVDRKKLLKS